MDASSLWHHGIDQKYPDLSPSAIKSAIVTPPDVEDMSGNPILNELHQPTNCFASGAGHVNPKKSLDPDLVYDIAPDDYIGYICGLYASQEVLSIVR